MFQANCAASSADLDIVYELTWSTRDYLIYSLNRYSQLLFGQALTADARNEIIELNLELLSILLGLPLQLQTPPLNQQPSNLQSLNSKSEMPTQPEFAAESNEIVLDLHWRTRSRLIDSLATNHSLAVLHGQSVASEAKLKLVEQNNELVNILLKLPARMVPDRMDNGAKKSAPFEHCKTFRLEIFLDWNFSQTESLSD